jgi:hypothetical protein
LLPLGRHAAYLAGRSFTSPRLQQAAMGVSSKGSIRAVVTPQHLSLGSNRSLPPPQSEDVFLLAAIEVDSLEVEVDSQQEMLDSLLDEVDSLR